MAFLYKNQPINVLTESDSKYHIHTFKPTLFKAFLKGEKLNCKTIGVRLSFLLMSKGQLTIYYVIDDNGDLMHTSFVLPKCFKFPYMNKGDYTIGPCTTYPQYRGRGIYPCVLQHILGSVSAKTVYMVVDEHNTPSIRGIEKAGFTRCGTIRKTKVLKRYYMEKGIQGHE